MSAAEDFEHQADDLADDVQENEERQEQDLGLENEDGEDRSAPPPEDAKPSDIEKLARAGGWKPEAEWKGDKTNWRPAADFVAGRLESAERAMKTLRTMEPQIAQVAATQKRLMDAERQRFLTDAEARIQEAVETGDTEAAIKALRDSLKAPAQDVQAAPPAVRQFEERNASWFGVNDEATAYAELVDRRLAAKVPPGQQPDPELHMKRVEEAVFAAFPSVRPTIRASVHDGEEPKRGAKPPLVGRGTRTAPLRGKATENDLPPAAKRGLEESVRVGMVKNTPEGRAAFVEAWFEENPR